MVNLGTDGLEPFIRNNDVRTQTYFVIDIPIQPGAKLKTRLENVSYFIRSVLCINIKNSPVNRCVPSYPDMGRKYRGRSEFFTQLNNIDGVFFIRCYIFGIRSEQFQVTVFRCNGIINDQVGLT